MIQAVIFDVGGVLVRTAERRYRQDWEQRLGLDEGACATVVFDSESGTRAQTGQLQEEAHWEWVGRELDLTAEQLAEFRRDFFAGDQLDTALVDYIRRLRGRYQTAIISNAMDGTRRLLHEVYPIADAFDLIVISAEEKVMKPDPRIFRRTLQQLGRQPEEAVFIDDFQHNVEGAKAVGMEAIHLVPHLDLPAELARLGVVPEAIEANEDTV